MSSHPNPSEFPSRRYRANQSLIASILLAEKSCDLFREVAHFCKKHEIPRNEAMDRIIEEMYSLIGRINDINLLPMQELLRLPPLVLAPENEHAKKSPEDRTEPNLLQHGLYRTN